MNRQSPFFGNAKIAFVRYAFSRARRVLASVARLASLYISALAADVTSTWNGTTGNWSDATRWSSNPNFPNNGNGGFTYDAIINSGSVTLDQDIAIEKLTLSGGTL